MIDIMRRAVCRTNHDTGCNQSDPGTPAGRAQAVTANTQETAKPALATRHRAHAPAARPVRRNRPLTTLRPAALATVDAGFTEPPGAEGPSRAPPPPACPPGYRAATRALETAPAFAPGLSRAPRPPRVPCVSDLFLLLPLEDHADHALPPHLAFEARAAIMKLSVCRTHMPLKQVTVG